MVGVLTSIGHGAAVNFIYIVQNDKIAFGFTTWQASILQGVILDSDNETFPQKYFNGRKSKKP